LSGAAGAQQIGFDVPLTGTLLGPGGVIPPGALDSVEQAGLSLLTPVVGSPGEPITVGGSILDASRIAGLSVNGTDVLEQVGKDGSFSVQLPGTTKVVAVKLVDEQGVSETQVIQRQSVAATRAVGVRIAGIRFLTRGAASSHRIRMLVTVKDRLGRLVRGAKVTVRAKQRGLARRPRASSSGRKGIATLVLRVRPAALGRRLVLVVIAVTPTAKALRTAAVQLPRTRA